MQSIRTKYFGPTNTRGSKIQARCEARTIFVGYDHALSLEDNHKAACVKLRGLLSWITPNYTHMVGGVYDGDYYWVFTGDISTSDPLP